MPAASGPTIDAVPAEDCLPTDQRGFVRPGAGSLACDIGSVESGATPPWVSQVRETAVFSGIPLVQRLKERTCGVWVVHIETGETVGFLRFEAGVQEIFAVQVLSGVRYPEILEWDDERLAHSYVLPDAALAEVGLPTAEDLARSPAFHRQRATELAHQGQLAEAIAAFRQGLALDPDDGETRYQLGVVLGGGDRRAGVRPLPALAEPAAGAGCHVRQRSSARAISSTRRCCGGACRRGLGATGLDAPEPCAGLAVGVNG